MSIQVHVALIIIFPSMVYGIGVGVFVVDKGNTSPSLDRWRGGEVWRELA